MMSPESRDPIVFAIAGQTATGKTRLGEGIVGELREQGYAAGLFSVGDMFRLLTMHTEIQHDPTAMDEAVQHTLSFVHENLDPKTGRIHIHYNGEKFTQTYENGNSSAQLSSNPAVQYHVSHFIETRITGSHTGLAFVGIDGRERRNAHILYRLFGSPDARTDARILDQGDACAKLTRNEIFADIAKRDPHEKPFVDALRLDDVNVVHIDRTRGTPEADKTLVQCATTVLVKFKEGKLQPNFGTIHIGL